MRLTPDRLARLRNLNPGHYVACPCVDCQIWRPVEKLLGHIDTLTEELADVVKGVPCG